MNKSTVLYEIIGILIILPHIGHIPTICGSVFKGGNKTMKFHHSFNEANANGIFLRDKASVIMNDGLSIVLILNGIIGESIQRLARVTSRGRHTSLPVIFNLPNHLLTPPLRLLLRPRSIPQFDFHGFRRRYTCCRDQCRPSCRGRTDSESQ